ncbi:hypothetical protein NHX12_015618 [Muraenolepis orangiensis]|uniref:Adrenocorticotropic hormone n=1 Tax=Muraenolepis orangiensis TaxID=630683 RepID=A0A9Q0DB27_9TELE|nr:hypothetical protein NHX12_015618 [Muraenolepis orangiensis]
MEHFRWGKPVGRKRRPIKVMASSSSEGEMRRELGEEAPEEVKKDGYTMKHFRWGSPPATKRYGGFMKSWDQSSHKPLITLFKNVMNKEQQQEA